MAIIKAAARIILKERAHYQFQEPVLCFGVPDVYLTEGDLNGLRSRAAPGTKDFLSASQFLAALGLSQVTSLDIPGSAHAPDLIHDLNQPLPGDLRGRFSLVIDPGTTEHVFDIRSGLINAAIALQVGGVVIHFVPIYSYNGGYFSINPNVLFDFYSLNGFADIRAYIIMWDRYRPFADKALCYTYTHRLEPRHALADHDQCRFTPHLLFFARKEVSGELFRSPIQHETHVEATEKSSSSRVKGLVRRVLPDELSTWLSAKLRRERQLRLSRMDSFWI